jgi:hypothetical protein
LGLILNKLTRILLLIATLGCVSSPCWAQRPSDFEARLELSRNGKVIGETTFEFASRDDRWTMHSRTSGRAYRLVPFAENSYGEGDWEEDQPRPSRYEREVRAVISRRWTVEFDWEEGVVHSVHPDGESTLDLSPGVIDETALGLIIRAGLARGEEEWFLDLVDEDEVDHVHFKLRSVEQLQTPLGCMQLYIVEKVRDPTSKRYTRTYYAAEYGFAPVVIEHGKHGDEDWRGQVVALSLDGQPVEAKPPCPP